MAEQTERINTYGSLRQRKPRTQQGVSAATWNQQKITHIIMECDRVSCNSFNYSQGANKSVKCYQVNERDEQ